jgi:ABC transporter substrate binding protein (PQQ-dependent alcohol dehydrogenase system)
MKTVIKISPALLSLMFGACALCTGTVAYADAIEINIVYLEQQRERPPVLSNLVADPEDEGEQGALLGIADNNTTGKFLKQNYSLEQIIVPPEEDVVAAARAALDGQTLVVTNVPAESLLAIADLPEASDDLIFNAGSASIDLRSGSCRPNVLHTLPSRAMLTDALMQFFNKRKWDSLYLLEGNREVDKLYADSIRKSAEKFRLSIDHEKQWIDDADMRRNAAQEIPLFTQARKYDAVVVADEDDDFGQYVLFNTWLPRPIAGTAGLEPVAWDRVVEQWGAAQLQSRFQEQAERSMTSIDYAAWAAVRSIGEAVTRTQSADAATIREYLFSDKFALAGFKGAKLTFRSWNGQLRQPIPLVHPQAVVALAPIEGFLHHTTELDTLGLDKPESACEDMN